MSGYWEKVTTGVKVKPWSERWRSADLELADTDVPRSCSLQNRSERREYPCRHWSCGWCLTTADKTGGGGEAKGGAAALLLHGRGDISVSGWPSAFHRPFGKFHRDGGARHLQRLLPAINAAPPAKDRAAFTKSAGR